MNSSQRNLHHKLPQQAFTLNGQTYDPREDHWVLINGIDRRYLHFDLFRECFSEELFNSIKQYFIWQVKNYTVALAQMYYLGLKDFVLTIYPGGKNVTNISVSEVISYCAKEKSDTYKRNVKYICCNLYKLGLPGIVNKDYVAINQIYIKPPRQGVAVNTCDPKKGPFTESEFQLLCDAIHDSYLSDVIDNNSYLLCLLLANLGQRPRQMAWLKACDLITEFGEGGSIRYFINMPMDKQGHVEPRTEFRKLQLHSEFAELLQERINNIKQEYLNLGLEENFDLDQLPLLPKWENNTCENLKYHIKSSQLWYKVSKGLPKSIGKILDRCGEEISLTPRRFRFTRGTNLMLNGATQDSIAYNMCHSSRQSAKPYIEFGAKHAEIIDKVIAPFHEPVINAFKGKVFERTNIVGTQQTYIPVGAAKRFDEAGFCVKPSGCAVYLPDSTEPEAFLARVPFACYRCLSFNAWNDIEIHQEHLEILIQERDMALKAFNKNGPAKQPGMAMALDPTIVAVESVIAKIEVGDISEFDLETEMVDSF